MMSQFENPYAGDPAAPVGETRMSAMAVIGLICSLVFCCPVVTVVGPILGAVALVRIGANAALRGRGLAIAAIVIGLVTTAGSGAFCYWIYDLGKDMEFAMQEEFPSAITAGAAGDYATFHASFHAGLNVAFDDSEAAAFFAEFERRYGVPTSMVLNPAQQPALGQVVFPLGYVIHTDTGQSVPTTVMFVMADEVTGELWVNKMSQIIVPDATDGDLVYPPAGVAADAAADPADAADDADHDHAEGDHDHDHDHADGDHDHDHGDDHE